MGALAAGATSVTDAMLRAAAAAVADTSDCTTATPDAGLLPPLDTVRQASQRIALAVASVARDNGTGDQVDDDELSQRIAARTWHPDYPEVTAS